MPVNDTARKYLTDVVAGANTYENSNAMQFNYDTVTVTSPFTVETLGIPVVWNDTNSTFEIFNDANAAEIAAAIAAGTSPLPGGGVVAVLVGTAIGLGFNAADVDYTAGVAATGFHRGANNAGVKRAGIDYSTAATSAPNQALFEAQLEVQGLMIVDNAEVISPTYTS